MIAYIALHNFIISLEIYHRDVKRNTINVSYDSFLKPEKLRFADAQKDPVKQGCNILNAKSLLIKMNQHFVKNADHEL